MKLSAPVFRLKRSARQLARRNGIPLHQALDRIACAEGFKSWAHLASRITPSTPASRLLGEMADGDMLLMAARPGHGKTLLALQMVAEAARAGARAAFFSSEMSDREIRLHLSELGLGSLQDKDAIRIGLNDTLCAGYVIDQLADAVPGTIAAIDYLQILDQSRRAPPLEHQVRDLKRFAESKGVRLVFLSQVHRSFDPSVKPLPDFSDLRLPNPLDLTHFDKGCFLHDGELALRVN